jgi:hypothetical protein
VNGEDGVIAVLPNKQSKVCQSKKSLILCYNIMRRCRKLTDLQMKILPQQLQLLGHQPVPLVRLSGESISRTKCKRIHLSVYMLHMQCNVSGSASILPLAE